MSLQYGFNFTESDIKRLLEQNDVLQNNVRSWRQLFGNASLGYNAQRDALNTDYASAIADAYKSNLAQRNAILGAGLSAGSTQNLLAQNQSDLRNAYETYVKNYTSAASTLAESYSEEIGAIDAALTERAQNFKNLYESAYKYLSDELYSNTDYVLENLGWITNMPTAEELLNRINTASTVSDIVNIANEYQTSVSNPVLKSWDILSQELFDAQGNLTAQGTEFFDQIFNAQPQGYTRTDEDGNEISLRTFDQWLNDTNPELRDWWTSADVYNYTRAGTNAGTTKTLVGMESDDIKYHQSEYLNTEDAENFVTKGMRQFTPITFSSELEETLSDLYASFKIDQANIERYRGNDAYAGYIENIEKKYTNASAQAVEEITSATSTASTNLAKYFENSKTLLGQERYEEFINSSGYTRARSAYDTAVDELIKSAKYVSTEEGRKEYEAALKKYEQAYKQVLNSMSTYIKQNTYTGKTSGF